jgi:hypothetical protein
VFDGAIEPEVAAKNAIELGSNAKEGTVPELEKEIDTYSLAGAGPHLVEPCPVGFEGKILKTSGIVSVAK